MSIGMPKEAWSRGAKNAALTTSLLIPAWLLISWIVSAITTRTLPGSFGIGFGVLWGMTLGVFAAGWARGRATAGQVVLDCGPQPMRWVFVVDAAIFLGWGLLGNAFFFPRKWFGALTPIVGISGACFMGVMAAGRLQFREHGIWAYAELLRWSKVTSYRWIGPSTLGIRRARGFALLRTGALPIPPRQKESVDALLADRVRPEPPA